MTKIYANTRKRLALSACWCETAIANAHRRYRKHLMQLITFQCITDYYCHFLWRVNNRLHSSTYRHARDRRRGRRHRSHWRPSSIDRLDGSHGRTIHCWTTAEGTMTDIQLYSLHLLHERLMMEQKISMKCTLAYQHKAYLLRTVGFNIKVTSTPHAFK